MRSAKRNACLVVTNPLHYLYVRREFNLPFIGSVRNTLLREWGVELGFDVANKLYDTPNSIHDIVEADAAAHEGYITWKTAKGVLSLGNSYEFANSLEHKAHIRTILPSKLFPEFLIIKSEDISAATYGDCKTALGSNALVMQVSLSTGGKGTYFITDEQEFTWTRQLLERCDDDIVVSRRIQGVSYGLQCFIGTRGVSYPRWWHKDLVNIPEVCNRTVAEATRYCGAVLENIPEKFIEQVDGLIKRVGNTLDMLGYRGIFGLDIVVEEGSDKVFLIELNPRFTAVSHVYATAMRAHGYLTDFMTATVKELLGDTAYSFGDSEKYEQLRSPYYYLKLQNMDDTPMRLSGSCRLGVYLGGEFVRFGFGIGDLNSVDEIVVIPEGDMRSEYAPGARMVSIIGSGDPFMSGRLEDTFTEKLQVLQKQFKQ